MKTKIVLRAAAVIFTALLAGSCKDEPAGPDEKPAPNPKLVWSDEFNAAELDLGKWAYETGTGVNGDFGTGQLDRATDRKDNVSIAGSIPGAEGGCLAITTLKENYIDRKYTSGRITTQGKGSWGPGHRLEARIWPRDVRYKGQGFAFWLMPAEKPEGYPSIMWPQGGEVDIMEYVGSIPYDNLGSVHYAWSWENNQYKEWNHGHKGAYYNFPQGMVPPTNPSWGGYPVPQTDMQAGSARFHTYAVDWYTDRMEFSIDSAVYHIHYFNDGAAFDAGKPDGEDEELKTTKGGKRIMLSEYSNHFPEWHPFEHNFFIILSAGVGGSDTKTYGGAITPDAVFPCTVLIDWIRVYKH